jgi:dTDP-4-amino-4,6-dideoxygalactose transaminase
MEAIMDIARRYGIKVIEDAAHSFPSALPNPESSKPILAGTIGDIGVFSFYATKTITMGEGGMVVCRDEEIARRISVMRSHGIDRTIWNRYSDARASWYYEVIEAGYKYNLPDILAAIGRVQLGRAWNLLRMREAIAAVYDSAFAGDERFLLPPTGPGDARHLYPLRLNPAKVKITRDDCISKLKESGIGTSVHFIPLHIMPYYKNRYRLAENDFPETMKSYRQEISLPIWPGMTDEQVNRVIVEIKKICT